MAKTSRSARPARVPEPAVAADAAAGKRSADAGGAQPDPALAEEPMPSSTTDTQGKPPRPDQEPETQSRDRAGLPADSGAGDPREMTFEMTGEREDRGGGDGDPAVPAKAAERIGVKVTGPKNGRRRLGRRFDERPQVIGATAGELEILRTDPTLSVELV